MWNSCSALCTKRKLMYSCTDDNKERKNQRTGNMGYGFIGA